MKTSGDHSHPLPERADARQVAVQPLYVEDNLSNRTLVQWVLDRDTDIDLIPATGGEVGLALAKEHRPAVIVLDLHLPDMRGEAVLQRLRADAATRDVPVVVLSADTSERRMRRLSAMGARACLTKPLDLSCFADVISRVSASR